MIILTQILYYRKVFACSGSHTLYVRYCLFPVLLPTVAWLSQHNCIKDMLPMKILSIPELSPRNRRNRRKLYLQLAESMGQLWLAEWKWLLTINLHSIYNSSAPQIFLNTMECDHREKGEGKRTILRYFIFLDRSFGSLILRRSHLHSQPFKLRRDCL